MKKALITILCLFSMSSLAGTKSGTVSYVIEGRSSWAIFSTAHRKKMLNRTKNLVC